MIELGIIAAMEAEAKPLIAQMTETEQEMVSGITFTKGVLHGHTVVVAVCGIGKVFAALCVQSMILYFSPLAIINTGVAGSLSTALQIGDLAVAENVVQHDMDTSPLGDPKGLISGINEIYLPCDPILVERLLSTAKEIDINAKKGTIASGDQFIDDLSRKMCIRDTFGAIACEMEGAAIGQVCFVNKVPFAVVRAISDDAAGKASMEYPKFVQLAAKRSVALLCGMIERM